MQSKPPSDAPTADNIGRTTGGRSRTAWRLLRLPITVYLMLVLAMMVIENMLIFIPSRHPEGVWQPAGLAVEDARFEADDQTRLHGWYVPCDDARAVVLYLHGNAGNITDRTDVLRILHRDVGATVLILDYRGYGRSEGSPNERGILADARAARAWLAQRENIAEDQIVLLGRSLGGAVAVDLAAKDGARALVLESTFSSMPDVASHHYRWLPVRWLMRTRLDSASIIGAYHGPLLQSHGRTDTIVPYRFGERLFEAANEPKELITFPVGDHNTFPPNSYYEKLAAFLDELD